MEHRKIPYGIQLLGRGGLSYFPRREIEGTGRISDLTDEGELLVYKPDTKEVAHTYEVDDEDDEDAVRNMMYDIDADIEDIYNVNIFADKIKLAKLEGGLQAKNKQIDKIKEEIEFAKKLISTKSVKGSKDEETLKEIQKMIDEISSVTIPKIKVSPEARKMGRLMRVGNTVENLNNLYNIARVKSLKALEKYKEKEDPGRKYALKKADIDLVKYGLDLIRNNPSKELDDIQKDIDKRIKQINTLVTYGGEYANVNGELVQLEKEKKKKYDELYKELAMQRMSYAKIDEDSWNGLYAVEEYKKIYDKLQLGDINREITELENGTYKKPKALTLKEITKKHPDEKTCDAFEEQFKDQAVTLNIIKQLDETFNPADVSECVIFQTETTYNDVAFNGEELSFKADANFPYDVIVFCKMSDNTVKKYVIELKYYDNVRYYTHKGKGEDGKINVGGDSITFQDLLEYQTELYDMYKKEQLWKLKLLKERLDEAVDYSDDEAIETLTEQISDKKKILESKSAFNEEFNKNIYGFYVAMKFTKTGFNFNTKPTIDGDYNNEAFYKHMQKYKSHQKIVNFSKEGKIVNVVNSGSGTEVEKAKILKGAKVLYCISYSDAIVGMNYSKLLNENKELIKNPFVSHHPVKSSYETTTDHVGFKLENFKLLK